MVLAENEAVEDVAVISVPNEEFGEEVKAIVQLSGESVDRDQLEEQLMTSCRDRLAGYKRPRSIDFIEALPRTGTGKILKRELRAPYWADSGRSI